MGTKIDGIPLWLWIVGGLGVAAGLAAAKKDRERERDLFQCYHCGTLVKRGAATCHVCGSRFSWGPDVGDR